MAGKPDGLLPFGYSRMCNGFLGLWLAVFFKAWDKYAYDLNLIRVLNHSIIGADRSIHKVSLKGTQISRKQQWKTSNYQNKNKTLIELHGFRRKSCLKSTVLDISKKKARAIMPIRFLTCPVQELRQIAFVMLINRTE